MRGTKVHFSADVLGPVITKQNYYWISFVSAKKKVWIAESLGLPYRNELGIVFVTSVKELPKRNCLGFNRRKLKGQHD